MNVESINSELVMSSSPGKHRLYSMIQAESDLHVFMEHHVFAVWDFMFLVKRIQRELAEADRKWWVPQKSAPMLRFISEVVLGEETDLINDRVLSHTELYLEAMKEVGADTSTVQACLNRVQNGEDPRHVISSELVPSAASNFMHSTFSFLEGTLEEATSAFLFGREAIIPEMFQAVLDGFAQKGRVAPESFTLYLQRHIELDGEEHSALGEQLLAMVCGTDSEKWESASQTAKLAIQSRMNFWEGIAEAIEDSRNHRGD